MGSELAVASCKHPRSWLSRSSTSTCSSTRMSVLSINMPWSSGEVVRRNRMICHAVTLTSVLRPAEHASKIRYPQSRAHEVSTLVLAQETRAAHLVFASVPGKIQQTRLSAMPNRVADGKCNVVTGRMLRKVSRAPSMRQDHFET